MSCSIPGQELFNSMAPGCHWCPTVLWSAEDGSFTTSNSMAVMHLFYSGRPTRSISATLDIVPRYGGKVRLLPRYAGTVRIKPG